MKYRYPTTEELYKLEREARRLRSQELARLLAAAVTGMKSFVARFASPDAKGVRHA
ncbi:MAG: hypothetical protein M3544_03590 [Pseudomonadota bacterium]|nr:hypothetical protein [Pseudomonadota bacterium]